LEFTGVNGESVVSAQSLELPDHARFGMRAQHSFRGAKILLQTFRAEIGRA
jgi:hypothetical protein